MPINWGKNDAHKVTAKTKLWPGNRVLIVTRQWGGLDFRWQIKTIKGRYGDELRFEDGSRYSCLNKLCVIGFNLLVWGALHTLFKDGNADQNLHRTGKSPRYFLFC